MLLGAYDIGSDILAHTVLWRNVVFNAAFFLPIIFRHRYVYIVIGAATACLFGYFLLVLCIWLIQFITGQHFKHATEMFGFGLPFCIVSFLLAVALVLAGVRQSQVIKTNAAMALIK